MNRLRVGLLTNPSAAAGAAQRIGRHVDSLLQMSGLSVIDLSGPTAAVAKARVEEIKHDLTALVVVGGDGTAALGASCVAGTQVRLGIVPAGSGNDLARALGLPLNNPDEAVRVLLHALSRPVVRMDAIELSGTGQDKPTLVLGNVSLGFDALVNARANRSRGPLGRRYTLAVIRELARFSALPYWVEIDGGERQAIDAALITLCNSGVMGGGMVISPDSSAFDGALELAVVDAMPRGRLVRLFPKVFSGTHTNLSEFAVHPVRESITVGLRDSRHLRAFADGEPHGALPITARIRPGAVRILMEPED